MTLLSQRKEKTIVGLDIEAGSVAATELRVNGSTRVTKHGITPLDPGVFQDGEVADVEALGAAIKDLFASQKLSRNVRLGIANQRVAVRMLELPPIQGASELETAIRFQAQDHIPMPLEQAVLDWEVIGHTGDETGERRIQVVVAAARRDMVGRMVEALHGAGLRPVGIDVAAFGMIRALADSATVGPAAPAPVPYEERTEGPMSFDNGPATLYCNLGDSVNLAVAQGTSCLFTRVSGFGIEGIAQKLAERRRLTLDHARQWLAHVGVDRPIDQVTGDPELVTAAREVLEEGAAKLVDELRLSLEYYGAQPSSIAVENVVACGPGTRIAGLVDRLRDQLGYPFLIGRAPALAHLDDAEAARLTLSYGLALEA
jgi:type IV pilus assembly protein PilM